MPTPDPSISAPAGISNRLMWLLAVATGVSVPVSIVLESADSDLLLDDFAAARPGDVVHRGGVTFVAVEAAPDVADEAKRRGVKVLGLGAFLVCDDAVYPALSRIADFSACSATEAENRARRLLTGEWASPTTAADQMHSDASGRYMLDIVLDD